MTTYPTSVQPPRSSPAKRATTAMLAGTVGLAAASWVVAVRRMHGMDMGVATPRGSFAFFIGVWVVMMAAMMLPGAAPALLRRARAGGRLSGVPWFLASYLSTWTLAGAVAFALYRPHGTVAAGAVIIAAGGYELTPFKRDFRQRGRADLSSGWQFGMCCVGSSVGLMASFVALGLMSVTWMAVIGLVVLAQKLLPVNVAIDVPVALAIVVLGLLVATTPGSIPGLVTPM